MPDDLDDLAVRLRALGAHLDVGEPADPWPAIRARLTEPMAASLTEPVSFDSAPYFAALVAISCTIIDRITASRGDTGTFGPDIRSRSGLLSR